MNSIRRSINLLERRTEIRLSARLAGSGARNRSLLSLESQDKCKKGAGRDQLTTAVRPVGGTRAIPAPVLKATPLTTVALFC
jgi:hypothetical protein